MYSCPAALVVCNKRKSALAVELKLPGDARQAVVVAPLQYTLMIWGTIYGYLVFGQLPDFWTWTGTAIIVATGIYTLHRERLAARIRAVDLPSPDGHEGKPGSSG